MQPKLSKIRGFLKYDSVEKKKQKTANGPTNDNGDDAYINGIISNTSLSHHNDVVNQCIFTSQHFPVNGLLEPLLDLYKYPLQKVYIRYSY